MGENEHDTRDAPMREKEFDDSATSSLPSRVPSQSGEPNPTTEKNLAGTTGNGGKTETVDDTTPEIEYPSGLALGLIMFAMCCAVLLVALDNTILATAIPSITNQFHSLDDVGWYISAYLLTTCSFQLLFGKFYTFFPIKTVYLIAISIFELGSLICGVSPNSTALIVGRAIAGLGCSGIFSGSLIILSYSTPLEKRPIYTALIGGMYGIASVVGPLLGGAFTQNVTWRWCFYINLPIGGLTIVLIAFFLKPPKQPKMESVGFWARLEHFDPIGTVCFIPAIICLLLALQWGGTTYPWSDGRIIALFVVFGVLIIAFVAVQIWKGELATVPPRIFMRRAIWSGSYFGFWISSVFFIFVYYLPIWFQAIEGVSAVESGIRSIPLVLAQVLGSIISGAATTAFGYFTPWYYVSTVFSAIGTGLLSTLQVDSSIGQWLGYQVILGLGTGTGFQQGIMAAQSTLEQKDISIGTATILFIQLLGGALFASVGENIFTNTLVQNLKAQIPNIDPYVVVRAGATQLKSLFPPEELGTVLNAYNGAITYTFRMTIIFACIALPGAIFMEWKSVKEKKPEPAGTA